MKSLMEKISKLQAEEKFVIKKLKTYETRLVKLHEKMYKLRALK